MANRQQRGYRNEEARELAQKKKANRDFRQVCPPRKNGRKDFSKNSSFPGFRKDTRKEKTPSTLVGVYKKVGTK